MKFTREKIIKTIEETFPSEHLGEGTSLRQAVLEDNYIDDPRLVKEAKDQDITDDWKKIPDEDLEKAFNMSVFTYLDKKGWRYYLPAAMHYAAKDVPSNSACDFYTTAHILDHSPEKLTEFIGLTPHQQKSIAMFLVLMHELMDGGNIFENNKDNYNKWRALLSAN